MVGTESIDFHSYLPPYRSLLTPNARYDYKTHSLVPIPPQELNTIRLLNARNKANAANDATNGKGAKIKMKYKSLFSDVSRRTSILSMRINNASVGTSLSNQLRGYHHLHSHRHRHQHHQHQPVQFKHLPVEILDRIFSLVDDFESYKMCLFVNKQFYQLSKPYLFQQVSFTSTYRFAQFITYLRLNSEVGLYVQSIDLSGIKPCNAELEESGLQSDDDENNGLHDDHDDQENRHNHNHHPHHHHHHHYFDHHHNNNLPVLVENVPAKPATSPSAPRILAGWRDWKFKNNPLYTMHYPSTSNLNGNNQLNSTSLTKVNSNSQISSKSFKSYNSYRSSLSFTSSSSGAKINRLSKFLKPKKRHRSHSLGVNDHKKSKRKPSDSFVLDLSNSQPQVSSYKPLLHPSINKFLYNYQSSKDIPVGQVLHLINVCPNITSLNLGNLSLSIDYQITPSMVYKYQTFDLMNNYPKDLVSRIDKILQADVFNNYNESIYHNFHSHDDSVRSFTGEDDSSSTFYASGKTSASMVASAVTNAPAAPVSTSNSPSQLPQAEDSAPPQLSLAQQPEETAAPAPPPPPMVASSASSMFSVSTFSKPIRKYNSLLPPLPTAVTDISYISKGDGKVYLSDLNLKSINNNYLRILSEDEVLSAITNLQANAINSRGYGLQYINLSSMLWLNKKLVQSFLRRLMFDRLNVIDAEFDSMDADELYADDDDDDADNDDDSVSPHKIDLVIDLTDSGMYKSLSWATLIDLQVKSGRKMAFKIAHGLLLESADQSLHRSRVRRGRMGENYLS